MLLSESEKIADHFQVLRESAFKVAVDELELGMKLAKVGKKEEAYKSKLQNALKNAKEGFYKVPETEQKIRCYEIMCICYLALDDPVVAMTSILHQTEKLFEDEYILNSLISLNKALSKHKDINKKESRFLETVFASVCGTIQICSERHAWKKSRDEFRKLFRSIDDIVEATDLHQFKDWENIQEKKSFLSLFKSTKISGLCRFRYILTDLAQSNVKEHYPLGYIRVEQKTDSTFVVERQAVLKLDMKSKVFIALVGIMTIIAIAIVVFKAMQAHKMPPKDSTARLLKVLRSNAAFISSLVKNLRLKVKPMLVTTNIFTTKLALEMKHQFEEFARDVDPEWWAVL
jgi:hypothetical protein